MPKQPKANKSKKAASADVVPRDEATQHVMETNNVETPGPMTVEELSAMVRRDHQKIEEMHKYMKHIRLMSGIRLGITIFLIVAPIILTIIALPPLMRGISSQLGGSGSFNLEDFSSVLEQLNSSGSSEPNTTDNNGDKVNYAPESEYPSTLSQPPADYNTWTPEQQEQWVKEQFDGKDSFFGL